MDFKKLTAQEVASKRFTPVRMREGYSIDEVDKFLEKMEDTIESYDGDVSELQRQVSELEQLPKVDSNSTELEELKRSYAAKLRELDEAVRNNAVLQNTVDSLGRDLVKANADVEAANSGRAAAEALASIANESLAQAQEAASRPMDTSTASGAAARILENAAKNYDELVAQGEVEARAIIDKAGIEATELRSSAELEAAETLAEANSAKHEAFANIESQKRQLEESVARLASLESRVRDELVKLYTSSLEEIHDRQSVVQAEQEVNLDGQARKQSSFGALPSFTQQAD